MILSKESQAQEYAEKIPSGLFKNPWLCPRKEVVAKFRQAYLDGYTACEQSQWRSVEEELPETYTDVLIATDKGQVRVSHLKVARKTAWAWPGNRCPNVIAWMPIHTPPLPDTNTKKNDRGKN